MPHRPKPPFDYWIWLTVAAIMLIVIGYALFGPHPFMPPLALR